MTKFINMVEKVKEEIMEKIHEYRQKPDYKSIRFQPERLNPETSKEDAIV